MVYLDFRYSLVVLCLLFHAMSVYGGLDDGQLKPPYLNFSSSELTVRERELANRRLFLDQDKEIETKIFQERSGIFTERASFFGFTHVLPISESTLILVEMLQEVVWEKATGDRDPPRYFEKFSTPFFK